MSAKPYQRVLLKLSGEQLAGTFDYGVDPKVVAFVAGEIKKVINSGQQLVLVVGGGNMVRGADVAGHGIKRVTADQMGMLSGLINAMAVTDIFESLGISTRCSSNVFASQVVESYSYRLAEKHLQNGRLLIVAAGIGRPYFTHDTGAVSIALELDCGVVLKATKFDGVYDKDPAQFPDARKLPKLSFQEALSNDAIKVMDKAALGLAMEQQKPIIIFDALRPGNIAKAASGQNIGTFIN